MMDCNVHAILVAAWAQSWLAYGNTFSISLATGGFPFFTHCPGHLCRIGISTFIQFADDIFMVFIVSILTQFVSGFDASDINCKTDNTSHFFLHKILRETFQAILGIGFMVTYQAAEQFK